MISLIIDFHTHIFPDAIAGPAIQSLAERSHATPYRGGTAADLKASMLEGGIDKSVLLHIVTKPKQFANVHRFALAVAEDNPEFISFGSFHPDSAHWRDEIRQIARDGLKGIKLHPDYQNFYVDEERLYPMYEAIFEENLILVFHAGLDIGYPDIHHCTPQRVLRFLPHFEGAPIVLAHMGGYQYQEDVIRDLAGAPVYLDAAYCLNHQIPPDDFLRIVAAHGADKILFATDSPWHSQKLDVDSLCSLPLSNEDQDAILWRNAASLLKLSL